jgi:hypothetical protein
MLEHFADNFFLNMHSMRSVIFLAEISCRFERKSSSGQVFKHTVDHTTETHGTFREDFRYYTVA